MILLDINDYIKYKCDLQACLSSSKYLLKNILIEKSKPSNVIEEASLLQIFRNHLHHCGIEQVVCLHNSTLNGLTN